MQFHAWRINWKRHVYVKKKNKQNMAANSLEIGEGMGTKK
jgi:hypothetical protein